MQKCRSGIPQKRLLLLLSPSKFPDHVLINVNPRPVSWNTLNQRSEDALGSWSVAWRSSSWPVTPIPGGPALLCCSRGSTRRQPSWQAVRRPKKWSGKEPAGSCWTARPRSLNRKKPLKQKGAFFPFSTKRLCKVALLSPCFSPVTRLSLLLSQPVLPDRAVDPFRGQGQLENAHPDGVVDRV